MQRNVGSLDRILRILVGLAVTALAFVGPQNHWFLLGLIPVATGVIGWCPAYVPFGISSHKNCCSKQNTAA